MIFLEAWKEEIFKWQAIKHFQDNWDINAVDFTEMFMKATEKTGSILTSMNNFPRGMIKEFAKADMEATRAMFTNLFDESKNIVERMDKFQIDAKDLRMKYGEGSRKSHYQRLNAISTYTFNKFLSVNNHIIPEQWC